MKICLKLKNSNVDVLNRIFQELTFKNSGLSIRQKADLFILEKVMQYVKKRAAVTIAITKNEDNKNHDLSFEYYEAYVLHEFLQSIENLFREDPYSYNTIMQIRNQLNQKLI